MPRVASLLASFACLVVVASPAPARDAKAPPPNFVFIFADDLRADPFGYAGSPVARTPHLDALARRGVRFDQATVVLSICSPSRATALTGRYPSTVGVTTYGDERMPGDTPTFPRLFKQAGYVTGQTGKWHVGNSPAEAGFDTADHFNANGAWYGRAVVEGGRRRRVDGFIEEWIADRSIAFMEKAKADGKPFVLWHCTQLPHLDGRMEWPVREESLSLYPPAAVPLPPTWDDDHAGKPAYLRTSRSYTLARERYRYGTEAGVREHVRRYYAAVTEVDRQIGRVLEAVRRLGLADNTYVVFQSDNGWLLGEFGLTSKVLAYEPSMRVPLIIAGPGIDPAVCDALAANLDVMPTMLDLAGLPVPPGVHGQSLVPQLKDPSVPLRDFVYYESPTPQLVPRPFYAVRSKRHKLIETRDAAGGAVEHLEFYDLQADPHERKNLADEAAHAGTVRRLREQLEAARARRG